MWPGNSIKACSTEPEALDGCSIVHPVSWKRERERERERETKRDRGTDTSVYILGCKCIALARA